MMLIYQHLCAIQNVIITLQLSYVIMYITKLHLPTIRRLHHTVLTKVYVSPLSILFLIIVTRRRSFTVIIHRDPLQAIVFYWVLPLFLGGQRGKKLCLSLQQKLNIEP
jgi:hypothetical protein